MQCLEHRTGDVPVIVVRFEIQRISVGQQPRESVVYDFSVDGLDADFDFHLFSFKSAFSPFTTAASLASSWTFSEVAPPSLRAFSCDRVQVSQPFRTEITNANISNRCLPRTGRASAVIRKPATRYSSGFPTK